MERFRNYGLWVAIGSFIILLLQTFGLNMDVGQFDKVFDSLLGILVLAGILNNPSMGKGFRDPKPKDKDN